MRDAKENYEPDFIGGGEELLRQHGLQPRTMHDEQRVCFKINSRDLIVVVELFL